MRRPNFSLFFYAENWEFKPTFRCYPLLQKWDIQKEKSKNQNVKMKMDQIRTRNSHFLLWWAGIFFVNASHRKPAETLSFCGFFLFVFSERPGLSAVFKMGPERRPRIFAFWGHPSEMQGLQSRQLFFTGKAAHKARPDSIYGSKRAGAGKHFPAPTLFGFWITSHLRMHPNPRRSRGRSCAGRCLRPVGKGSSRSRLPLRPESGCWCGSLGFPPAGARRPL